MRRIVVTGAAGFIGSHLCEALLDRGDCVVGIDNFDSFYDPAVKRRNVARFIEHPDFELHEVDIRDSVAIDTAMTGAEAVVHLAARAGVRPSIEQPMLYQDVNVTGTCVLLESARNHGVTRFVFGSSSSVYGNNPKVPFSETDNVDHPISPYAATKKAGELLGHTYAHLFGLQVICLRFFTVFGPRQRPDLAIHKFTRLIESGEPIPLFGDGSTSRDYTYVADIVDGILRALDVNCPFRIFNLGGSHPITLSELVAAIERALGKKAHIERLPTQPGDVERTYADVSRAQEELGYAPATSLDVGLERFVAWFRQIDS